MSFFDAEVCFLYAAEGLILFFVCVCVCPFLYSVSFCELPCGCWELNPLPLNGPGSALNCLVIYPAPAWFFYWQIESIDIDGY